MTWFFGNKKSLIAVVVLALILAAGIRFYDLTDLPLDFAPTRQLFSALKARGMYYAMLPASENPPFREIAINQWHSLQVIEPPLIESLVALTYRVFGEHLWIARIYSLLFWVLAGIPLFFLAKEIAGPGGAFISLLYYLFLPYGVIASRTFQPDPLMVALIATAAWASFHWANRRDWKWALITGILNGLAIFVKNVSVFPLAFAMLGLVFEFGFVKSIKDKQTWTIAGLSLLPSALYTLYGVVFAGFLGQQFAFRFFPQLWLDPGFYLRWLGQIEGVVGFGAFAAGIIGIFVAKRRGMFFLSGLFAGYLVYGMTFAYHISTHDYYQLPLIPIAALALSPIAETLLESIAKIRSGTFVRALLALLIMLVVSIQLWDVRVTLARDDWRPDAAFWQGLGEKLGYSGPVLTIAQDYGYRLAYWGWQEVDSWYDSGDLDLRALDGRKIDLLQRFQQQVMGKKYLVITQLNKLDNQPEIKSYIYKTYPVFAQDKGYVIFDLTKTK